jgi:putative endonuclease
MNQNKVTGNKGEEMAAQWLEANGYALLEKNWRFKHLEVDIIAAKQNRLHFIEVKTRFSQRFGQPEESIRKEKMKNLKNAAEEYQYLHTEWKYIQFDVIAITLANDQLKDLFLIEDVYF